MQWHNGQLKVTCTEGAANPIVWGGRSQREIIVGPGETFRIGTTEFRIDPTRQDSDLPQAVAAGLASSQPPLQATVNLGTDPVIRAAGQERPVEAGIELAAPGIVEDDGNVEAPVGRRLDADALARGIGHRDTAVAGRAGNTP